MKGFLEGEVYWHGQGEELYIDCVLDVVLTWVMERLILARDRSIGC